VIGTPLPCRKREKGSLSPIFDQRKRNINQLLPGTVPANPGVNANALRPFLGMGIIGLSENTLGSANGNPTSGSFGLVTSKTGNRNMQIVLQLQF
jgi:hypothetical protein